MLNVYLANRGPETGSWGTLDVHGHIRMRFLTRVFLRISCYRLN